MGWHHMVAEAMGRTRSEPRSSLVTQTVMAEPLNYWRTQHASGRCSMNAPARITGVAGTARREGKVLNVGDLAWCGWLPQPANQGCQTKAAGQRGVGGAHSTDEGGESRWREGKVPARRGRDALPGDATRAGKDRRLWRH
jgi:hypothetical protein